MPTLEKPNSHKFYVADTKLINGYAVKGEKWATKVWNSELVQAMPNDEKLLDNHLRLA